MYADHKAEVSRLIHHRHLINNEVCWHRQRYETIPTAKWYLTACCQYLCCMAFSPDCWRCSLHTDQPTTKLALNTSHVHSIRTIHFYRNSNFQYWSIYSVADPGGEDDPPPPTLPSRLFPLTIFIRSTYMLDSPQLKSWIRPWYFNSNYPKSGLYNMVTVPNIITFPSTF